MFADRTTRVAARITSSKNPLVKDVRQAIDRGTLTREGLCVAETFHLLEEAVRSHSAIETVLAAESVFSTVERRIGKLNGVRVLRLPDELFGAVSSTETSQGVVSLIRPPHWEIDAVFRGKSLVVVLDGLQDPGNAGAILRAAEAFGATGAMFLKGTVNPYNPKAMRASAGSIFRLPVVAGVDPGLAIAALGQRRTDVYAAMPRAAAAVSDVDLSRRCALVIGSEGRGVSATLAEASAPVRIPTCAVESLNAAVAAGILLYEASRQRRLPA
jgi:TrmH family RNA methyltransferase